MRATILIVAMLTAVPSGLTAQEAVTLGVGRVSVDHGPGPVPDSPSGNDLYRKRLGAAAIGGLTGAVALGGLAALASAGCERDCFGNFVVVLASAMLGTVVGSAYGAAIPEGNGRCTRTQRFGMGMGGAFLGVIPALAFLPIILVTAPVGSVMFMRNC